MSSSPPSVRHRGGQSVKKRGATSLADGASDSDYEVLAKAKHDLKSAVASQWDYKLALTIITVLAFATRFYGISHPNQVVFDEVHFGKVSKQQDGRNSASWDSPHAVPHDLLTSGIDYSLPHTTYKELTSSTYTLHSANSFSLSLAGLSVTKANSSLTTSAIPTLQTKSHT